jgi:hypothetical protein
LLATIWRENKPSEPPFEASDNDSSLLSKATDHLKHEQGEELKALLKESFGSPDDVCVINSSGESH